MLATLSKHFLKTWMHAFQNADNFCGGTTWPCWGVSKELNYLDTYVVLRSFANVIVKVRVFLNFSKGNFTPKTDAIFLDQSSSSMRADGPIPFCFIQIVEYAKPTLQPCIVVDSQTQDAVHQAIGRRARMLCRVLLKVSWWFH